MVLRYELFLLILAVAYPPLFLQHERQDDGVLAGKCVWLVWKGTFALPTESTDAAWPHGAPLSGIPSPGGPRIITLILVTGTIAMRINEPTNDMSLDIY